MSDSLEKRSPVEQALLASRYVLVPMYLGLIVYMIGYNVAFFGRLLTDFKVIAGSNWDFDIISDALELGAMKAIDTVMVANLLIMILVGSQSIFVNEIKQGKAGNIPRFLHHLSSSELKSKMAASMVGVTSVSLLISFVKIDRVGWNCLIKELIIHIAFLIGVIIFTKADVMKHPPQLEEEKEHEIH